MPELNGLSFFTNKKDDLSTKKSEQNVNMPENEEIFPIKKLEKWSLKINEKQ